VLVEPAVDAVGARAPLLPLAVKLGVRPQLAGPALGLPVDPPLAATEVRQSAGGDVDPRECGQGVHHSSPGRVLQVQVAAVRLGQAVPGAEAVDVQADVEGRTERLGAGAGRHQQRMRHLGAGEGGEHPRLPPHRLVAAGRLVQRRAAQHVPPVPAREREQHVLGTAGQQLRVDQRTRSDVLLVQPAAQGVEVDGGLSGRGSARRPRPRCPARRR
jgi:hypothetical protein